jgi:hypothetical protein
LCVRVSAALTAVLVAALTLGVTSSARALTITLSDFSNDTAGGNAVPASDLNATLELIVTGNDTLRLDIENATNTLSSQNHDISAFVFNTSDQVSNVVLTAFPDTDAGWAQAVSSVGSFGDSDRDDGASALPEPTDDEIGLIPDLVNTGEAGVLVFTFD